MPAKDDGLSAKLKEGCALFPPKERAFGDCGSTLFGGREARVPDDLVCGSMVGVRTG